MNFFPLVAGLFGGLSATGPMTILMERWHRQLPAPQQYSLPPKEITHQIAEKVGIGLNQDGPAAASLVLLNHFAYGSAAGILYAVVAGNGRGGLIKGSVFGVGVWLISYFGLLPAVSVLTSAKDHPAPRNLLMLAAHILWGIVVGLFVETMLEDSHRRRSALARPSTIPAQDTSDRYQYKR